MTQKSIIIAVAGPTGSGKTFFAQRLRKKLGIKDCRIINQDHYYKDWAHIPLKDRKKINFDDIRAFDFPLLISQIKALKKGKYIMRPCYSFLQHCRTGKKEYVRPDRYIIIEGLMPYAINTMKGIFDLKIYIDAGRHVCIARRIKRDIKKRDETIESVCRRFFVDVLPMQEKYVEPQKKYADIVLNGNSSIDKSVNKTFRCIKHRKQAEYE